MMREFNAYIDESGDEGLGKGSHFFILTAIVVDSENDLNVSRCVDEIKKNLELDVKAHLHWNKVKGYPNKKMIVDVTAKQDITIMNVVIDTNELKHVPTGMIYTYFSGYLYERICWLMRESNGVCNINISHRAQMKTSDIISYINNPYAKHNILVERIGTVKIIPNAKKKLLQLADCCCSALGQALKYQDSTHLNYVEPLLPRYYRHNNGILSYGLKYVPRCKKLPEIIMKINDLDKKME